MKLHKKLLGRSACALVFGAVLAAGQDAGAQAAGAPAWGSASSRTRIAASGGPVLLDKSKDDDDVYKIVYELNGGVQNQANVDFYSGRKDVPLASPTRSGYVFAGWWDNPNGTGKKVERIRKGASGEQKLYALWKLDKIEETLRNDMSLLVTAIPLGKVCRVEGLCNSDAVETLDAFAIGKHEVTQALYYTVMGKNPSKFSSSPVAGDVQDQRPVESVSYDEVIEFCNALSELAGRTKCYRRAAGKDGLAPWECDFSADGYRLPTEAEWEFAARGGLSGGWDYSYAGSNSIYDVAWFYDNAKLRTHQVGRKRPNALGLYDMSGNVWEWCWNGKGGAVRGGSGGGEGSQNAAETSCKVYFQNPSGAVGRNWTGFRICRTLNAESVAGQWSQWRFGDLFTKPIHRSFSYIAESEDGLGMACPSGTPIYAALAGTVSATGWSDEYGNYVIVTHHSGYKTLYGHMSKITTVKGAKVGTNSKIGEVGSTGQSTDPHLLFVVYKNGRSVVGSAYAPYTASEKQRILAMEEATSQVYWTTSGTSFHIYEDCQHLNLTEELTLGSTQEAEAAGKAWLCRTCFERHEKEQQTAIPIGEEYTQQREDYDWYTSLDQVRTQTSGAIPASVVVQVALGYSKEDKAAATEITSRRIKIIDFLRRYFSTKTQEELRHENEEVLKQQIRDQINDDILGNSRIRAVMFTAKDVVSQ